MSARTSSFRPELTPESFNKRGAGHLPGLVGIAVLSLKPEGLETLAHLGRTTQVWDAVVTIEGSDRKIALFRCTQMVLWSE